MLGPGQEQIVPDDYLRAIGDVIVRWNALEAMMSLCLIKLLGKEVFDGRSHIVFAHMTFPQRMDVLAALVGEYINLPPNHPLSLYKANVQPLLKDAQTRRNKIAHGIWGCEDGKVHISSLSARGSLKTKSEPISIQEINTSAEVIVRAGTALFNMVAVGLPDKRSPQWGR